MPLRRLVVTDGQFWQPSRPMDGVRRHRVNWQWIIQRSNISGFSRLAGRTIKQNAGDENEFRRQLPSVADDFGRKVQHRNAPSQSPPSASFRITGIRLADNPVLTFAIQAHPHSFGEQVWNDHKLSRSFATTEIISWLVILHHRKHALWTIGSLQEVLVHHPSGGFVAE